MGRRRRAGSYALPDETGSENGSSGDGCGGEDALGAMLRPMKPGPRTAAEAMICGAGDARISETRSWGRGDGDALGAMLRPMKPGPNRQ